MAALELFTESLSILLDRESGELNTVAEPPQGIKMFDHGGKYPVWIDPSCRLSAHSSRCGSPSIMKCDVDIGKVLYAKLSGGIAVFHGIGEQIFLFFSNCERRSQPGHKVGSAEGECWIAHRLDTCWTLAHLVSLVTELLCALDHSSNAFALAQVASQNRLTVDMVAEC